MPAPAARTLLFATGVLAASSAAALAAPAADPFAPVARITAETFDSGFADAHDTYNGMGTASDGRIFYVLCSERHDLGGQMYAFDPKSKKVQHIADLNDACGEKGAKAIAQGKSHVNFVEANGKLYFATHIGFYSMVDGMEKMGIPPAGWKPYPGGHVLAYDLKSGKFDDLGIAPEKEGVLTFNMDTKRGRAFGLTWPSGIFFRVDVATKQMKSFGRTAREGENGKGQQYRTICRSIAVNPDDGSAWFTIGDGDIFRYDPKSDSLSKVAGEDLRKDYFGLYDPTNPGHMGYNWRQTAWHARERAVYGVHGNSGYLFRFDPAIPRVEVLERLTSLPSRRSGMFDQFSYGYLGFTLGNDGQTLHYLTGAPIYVDGKRVRGKDSTAMGEAKGLEDLHLITYHIPSGRYRDHGAIFYPDGQRPLYVNAITIGKDGSVYFLARIKRGEKTITDLVRLKGPFTP